MDRLVVGHAVPERRFNMEVFRITSVEPVTMIVVSRNVFGQWVHWAGNRSSECKIDSSTKCHGHEMGWPVKWQGYLQVIRAGEKETAFWEFTQACFHKLADGLQPDQNFRGAYLRVRKSKGGKKGRYIVEHLEKRFDSETLPQERDPLPVLKFLWTCKRQSASQDQDILI